MFSHKIQPIFVLCLDIGGANTKYSFLKFNKSNFDEKNSPKPKSYKNILENCQDICSNIEYFPFWLNIKQDFKTVLQTIKDKVENIINSKDLKGKIKYNIVVTITAELSDAFFTKKEGIEIICNCLKDSFQEQEIKIIDVQGDFIGINEALRNHLSVSASNWVSTSLVLGEGEKYAILLDIGSTTLDLIPIHEGKPTPIGLNDLDRLRNGELFYTGILRPPIASIVHEVPYKGNMIPISFEYFANMADVYSILKKITIQEYSCDTADRRDKTLKNCYARLSRIICGDPLMIAKEDLDKIAIYIYEKHEELIKNAIDKSIKSYLTRFRVSKRDLRFITTGLGKDLILKPILQELGIESSQIIQNELSKFEHLLSTAFCLGIHYIYKIIWL